MKCNLCCKWPMVGLVVVGLVGLAGSSALLAGGNYVQKLPVFKLKDPGDTEHSQDAVLKTAKKGLVVVVTIPNAKHGTQQSSWQSKLMKKDWPAEQFNMIMLEDLSQSGSVKDKALDGMKKNFKPEKQPLLLIDYTGDVRKSFNVPQDTTVLLVFDKDGQLVHAEDEQSTNEESQPTPEAVQRVQKVIKNLTK
ncbi:MAG: hypothetical protein HY291_22035 [Planctomycetes bacterium]|nr:hypothetical protein [Planctomycetota bacterium]